MRVLVVEDDPPAAELLASLIGDAGEVAIAPSLRQAFDAIALHRPECVLLDLELPDAEGLDAVAGVVARHPDVAVLVVTASDDDETALTAIAMGAQDVLVKGAVDAVSLVRKIRLAVERKRVEWSFFRSEERHRRMLDAAPVGIWRGDASRRTTYANRHLARLLGRDLETRPDAANQGVLGTPLAELIGTMRPDELEALFAAADDGGHARTTLDARGRAGLPVHVSVTRVVGSDGDHEYLAFIDPATADKSLDPEAGDPAVAVLLQNSHEALVVVNREGTRILSWSAGAEALYGVRAAEMIGRSLWDFVPRSEHAVIEQRRQRAVAGLTTHYETFRRRPNGEPVQTEVTLSPVFDADGRVDRIAIIARDVTEMRRVESAKRQTEQLLQTVIEAAPIAVTMVDADGTFTYVNGRGLAEGVEPASFIGKSIFEVYADADPEALTDVQRALAGEDVAAIRHYLGRSWDTRYAPLFDDAGTVTGAVGVSLDITERVIAESRFSQVVEHVSDVISIHRLDGTLLWASPAATRMLGLPSGDEADGTDATFRIHASDRPAVQAAFRQWRLGRGAAVEYRLSDITGALRYVESVGVNLADHPAIGGIVVTTRDVTERREVQRELAHAALHDRLTSLPNRPLLVDRIRRALDSTVENGGIVAVVFVDIDHFKLINDAFSHTVGDEVLRRAADLVLACVRPDETVSRVSGDGFAICFHRLDTIDGAVAAAEAIVASLTGPMTVGGHELHLSASAGVVISTGPADPEQLIADAEVAMYAAKERGRGQVEVFNDGARSRVVGRLALEQELRDAIAREEFRLFYQPQVQLHTGEIVSFEALIRWEHPTRGLLNPGAFIDVAEQSRLIEPIGTWVLEEACRQAAEWKRKFPERRFTVAVNLSARQLSDDTLPDLVSATIAAAGIDPSTLCLEITESMLMEDAERAVTVLRRLKECGVHVALDDFGTGYSSLAYLKRFPLEQLKVDRSFVAGLGRDPEDFVIVSAVVNLAKSLGVEVVAEGVENERHLAELAAIGCTLAQGYLWSPPVPASAIPGMLSRGSIGTAIRPVAPVDRVADRSSQAIDVVSLLTHELRAPLTVIKGYAETMSAHLGDSTPSIVAKASAAIARNVTTLDDLIATLSDVNALESGTLPLRRKPVDVARLVHGIINDHRHLFPHHEVRFIASSDQLDAYVDAARVQQILLNLLSNAAKFGPPEHGIDVSVTRSGTDVEVSVVDHGPGIPPELIGEIFRKFFRVDTGKKGTGLGLYIARSLARAHGGELSCRTAASGGAEFVLTVPRSKTNPDHVPSSVVEMAAEVGSAAPTRDPGGGAFDLPPALRGVRDSIDHAVVVEQLVGALISAAVILGGGTTPARVADVSALSHEISLGVGEPLLVTAPPGSPARPSLDLAMPDLIDLVERAVARIDDALTDESRVDPVTGLTGRRLLSRTVSRLRTGATILLLRVSPCDADVLRALSRLVRNIVPASATAGRFGDDQIALLLPPDTDVDPGELTADLEARWVTWQPRPAALSCGIAIVGSEGTQAALLAASAAFTRVD